MHGTLTGRPTTPDPETAKRVIATAAELAHSVPVLHDISDGGLAVAVAEICIAAGVGATIVESDTDLLFTEDPHRFVAVFEPGSVDLPDGIGRRVGTMGGETLILGQSEPIPLDLVAGTYRNAIPRRMAPSP
jgi:phosphoribosylformylglycinamidine synthase